MAILPRPEIDTLSLAVMSVSEYARSANRL
jgi:hypothetical protein